MAKPREVQERKRKIVGKLESSRSLRGPELQEHEPMQAMKNNTPGDEHKNEILSWDRGASFFSRKRTNM